MFEYIERAISQVVEKVTNIRGNLGDYGSRKVLIGLNLLCLLPLVIVGPFITIVFTAEYAEFNDYGWVVFSLLGGYFSTLILSFIINARAIIGLKKRSLLMGSSIIISVLLPLFLPLMIINLWYAKK